MIESSGATTNLNDQNLQKTNFFSLEKTEHYTVLQLLPNRLEDLESPVTLTEARMHALDTCLQGLQQHPPKGLIITGPRKAMFTVGADVHEIDAVETTERGEALARYGGNLFQRIAELPFPTVAAISGPCVGGGLELALACDFRICSDEKSTMLALPEVKLGIVPGFGGTQRLPRLIGLGKALPYILSGKSMYPKVAKKLGVISEIVSFADLIPTATRLLANSAKTPSTLSWTEWGLTHTSLGRMLVKAQAEQKIPTHYPAPRKALHCVIEGLSNGIHSGLQAEAQAIGELVVCPVSRALRHIYFLTEHAKGIGKTARGDLKDIEVHVIGAGTMGAGIAEVSATKGFMVQLRDLNKDALESARKKITSSLGKISYLSPDQRKTILERITFTTEINSPHSRLPVVIEAVVEDQDIKTKVLNEYVPHVPEHGILSTNTSSINIDLLANGLEQNSADLSERVIGMHFFNPVPKRELVEIVRGTNTSVKSIVQIAAFAKGLGKVPIVVESVPGFLVNRILSPYICTSIALLEQGFSITAIDKAAREFGLPMGPFEVMDEVGLDVVTAVSEIVEKGYGSRMHATPFPRMLIEKGRLGKKNGKGFYIHDGKQRTVCPELPSLLNITSNKTTQDPAELWQPLIFSILVEAVKCLEEGVAGEIGGEAAGQIDLGTVYGFGFPPFRGGILYYAEHTGLKKVVEILTKLSALHGERLTAPKLLVEYADAGKSFYE